MDQNTLVTDLQGKVFALSQQTPAHHPTLVVIYGYPSGSHSPYFAPFNPPPTQDQELTICETYTPVDPTRIAPKVCPFSASEPNKQTAYCGVLAYLISLFV